jgi:hypothetical protein
LNGRPCQEAAIGHFLVFQAAGIGLPKRWTGVFFRRSGTVFRAQWAPFFGRRFTVFQAQGLLVKPLKKMGFRRLLKALTF